MTVRALLSERHTVVHLDREFLLANIVKKDRTFLFTHPERRLVPTTVRKYRKLIARRARGEPLAYLTGAQPFYGLDFLVSHYVLIPRPETEWLVEQAHATLHEHPEIRTVIDLGTGSGAIAITFWKSLPPKQRRLLRWYATDISASALAVARLNAKRHQARTIRFLQGDLLKPFTGRRYADNLPPTAPTLLLANLPYLTTDDYRATATSGNKKCEPKIALEAGQDGLRYYRRLVAQISKTNPSVYYCLWEIDPCHSQTLQALIKKTLPKSAPKIYKDFNNLDRYLTATIVR